MTNSPTHLSRRQFVKTAGSALCAGSLMIHTSKTSRADSTPNLLFAIADDWSFPHASIYGTSGINTPAFDRIANEGCLFTHAYAAAPQCSPNRASILTGRNIWQNEEAGTHASYFPKKFPVFTGQLENNGYVIGTTGKPWGPGNWRGAGWERNPAGPDYNEKKIEGGTPEGIRNTDYAANFEHFLTRRPDDQPFFFWYGSSEPHRSYKKGIGLEMGKKLEDAQVPSFLPDTPEIRSDILDYYVEVEWYDQHLQRILTALEEAGELDNTLIIATSDNGMPFPRAKANLYDFGTHMPLAVRWGDQVKGGRVIDDLISSIDFAPTYLEAAGVDIPASMSGKSLLDVLQSNQEGWVDTERQYAYSGRERHTDARYDNLGYPARAIYNQEYAYIRNLKPNRWPAGDPPNYHDIDECPSKTFLLENQHDPKIGPFFELAVGKHPQEELYNVNQDPGCINNLANDPDYSHIKTELYSQLRRTLREQNDPRIVGSEIFDSYPRFSPTRPYLGGFHERGEYNPKYR